MKDPTVRTFDARRRRRVRIPATILTVMLILGACSTEDRNQADPAAPGGDGTKESPQPTTSAPPPAVSSTPTSSPSGEPPNSDPSNKEGDRPKQDEDRGDDRKRVRILRRGAEGAAVLTLQERLEKLRYWLGPKDGVYGFLTEQAVLAFQGAEHLARDGVFGPDTRRAMKGAEPVRPDSLRGDHIEIDESRGLVIIVRDGSARWVFHTSTGTEEPYQHPSGETYLADTPNGEWTFTWEVDGWRDGRLGRMWRPKYFHEDGIAIHGYPVVPAYPASHGCARVTMDAMDFIWRRSLAPLGSRVIVYGRS